MTVALELTGLRFGRLVAIEKAPRTSRRMKWRCACDCGQFAVIRASHLKAGLTISCGCAAIEKISVLNRTHGLSKTKVYQAWLGMFNRCDDEKYPLFHRYGGRGITICHEWRASFEAFYTHMGMPPGKKFSIDRIDNDGNYEPGNCRWATATEQASNRRTNVFVEVDGVKKTMSRAARDAGISFGTLRDRLAKGEEMSYALRPAKTN